MASWDEPPRFGSHGEAPPVRTDPELVSEGFTLRIAPTKGIARGFAVAKLTNAVGPVDAEVEQAREWLLENYSSRELTALQLRAFGSSALTAARFYFPPREIQKHRAAGERGWPGFTSSHAVMLFRLRMYYFWEREDPLTRLSVGTGGKITRKVVVGLSTAVSHEISTTLGTEVNLGGGGKISRQQTIKDAITLTRTEQREDSRELTLPSPATGTKRWELLLLAGRYLFLILQRCLLCVHLVCKLLGTSSEKE